MTTKLKCTHHPTPALSEPSRPKKLLDQVWEALQTQHYSIRTENAYVDWIKRFILFHNKRHPKEMSVPEVEAFLTYLAVERRVAASAQNQALSALLFLYREVLREELGPVDSVRARKPKRLPTVLTKSEALRVITAMSGTPQLMAKLLYGSGLRAIECARLRVKDIDFEQRPILVRDGKGGKDRMTMLPDNVVTPLLEHLERVRQLHAKDLAEGHGAVYLPYALAVKYPGANREWAWQYVFPARSLSVDPRSGARRRHHVNESSLQKAVQPALAGRPGSAARLAEIAKPVGGLAVRSPLD